MNDDGNDYDDDDVAWRAVVLYDFVYEHNGILYKNSKITNQVGIHSEEKNWIGWCFKHFLSQSPDPPPPHFQSAQQQLGRRGNDCDVDMMMMVHFLLLSFTATTTTLRLIDVETV